MREVTRVQEEATVWAQGKPSRRPDRVICLLRQIPTYDAMAVGSEYPEVETLGGYELLLVLEDQPACKTCFMVGLHFLCVSCLPVRSVRWDWSTSFIIFPLERLPTLWVCRQDPC